MNDYYSYIDLKNDVIPSVLAVASDKGLKNLYFWFQDEYLRVPKNATHQSEKFSDFQKQFHNYLAGRLQRLIYP